MADRDPDTIKQEIDQARNQLASTVDSLAERANPRRIADDVKAGVVRFVKKPPRGVLIGRAGCAGRRAFHPQDPEPLTGQRSAAMPEKQPLGERESGRVGDAAETIAGPNEHWPLRSYFVNVTSAGEAPCGGYA